MTFMLSVPTAIVVSQGGEVDSKGNPAGVQLSAETQTRRRPPVEGPLGEVRQGITFKTGQQGLYSTVEFHVSVMSQVPNDDLTARTVWADEDHQWLMETLNRRAADYNKLREVVGMAAPLAMPKTETPPPAAHHRPVLL